MAAPSTVYKDFKTRRRKAGTPDVDIDLFIAKFLQNTTPPSGDNWGDGYFNSTDTEAQKIAKIKDIFKIDGWVNADTPIQKAGTITISGTSVTGSGTAFTTDFVKGQKVGALVLTDGVLKCVETYIITAITSATAMSVVAGTNRSGIAYANYHQGFIGYCFSRNSGNGLYHNWDNNTSPFVARGSGVRVPTTAQASAELLNDAGLNLKGTCLVETIYARWANYIRFKAIYRSSFYNPTTQHGAVVNSTTWNRGTIAPKVKSDQSFILLPDDIDPSDTISIAPFITNEEGTTTNNSTSATALEKIWAASGAGDGVGGGTVYKLTNANDPITDDKIYNSNGLFMTLEEFKFLNGLPTSGTQPEEDVIGYKNDLLYDTTTPTKVEAGYYYIWNYATDPTIPIYGNYQGTSGKVFYADSTGQFTYYIARSVSIPTIKVYVDMNSASQFNVRAAMVSASGGSEVPYNNNLGVNIVITLGARWYNSLTGAAVVASTFTPTSRNLTILQGENLSNIVTFDIDDTDNTELYIGAYEISKTPAPNGSNYSGAVYLRTLYGY